MIYGRTGQPVTILRRAVLQDVERLDRRKPDKKDRAAIKSGSYVVVMHAGKERLYHQAYLKADDGSYEITKTLEGIDQEAHRGR